MTKSAKNKLKMKVSVMTLAVLATTLANPAFSAEGGNKTSSRFPEFVNSASASRRIGISFGGLFWGSGFLSASYDQTKVFAGNSHWSLGLELGGAHSGFILSPRALYWQKTNMSGFYAGPRILLGFFNDLNNSRFYSRNNDASFMLGVGGEGGWSYRFEQGPKGLDLGVAAEVAATTYGFWSGLKFTIGYLIPS